MSLNNRILLSSPCYGKVDPEILEDWMSLAYHCGRRMPEYDFFLGIKSKSEQFRARNLIVEAAQQFDCDRILMLDDDMVMDIERQGRDAYEFLPKLIANDKDICGVLYYQRGAECQPVLMAKLNEKGYRFMRDDEITYGLQRVDVAGGGCLLIKTRVFDRIPFPYFGPEFEYGTDVQLCRKAAEKGFEIWADTSIELGHLRNEKAIITSRNRHQFMDAADGPVGIKRTFVMADLESRLIQDALEYTQVPNVDELFANKNISQFLVQRKLTNMDDADWYREYPRDRVGRQVWFNTQNSIKKKMNQFILASVTNNRPLRVLDFGCGIGITAFALAEKGHQVTACDIRGTGTLEFLKWRCAKHNVPMEIIESEGGSPLLTKEYDIIVAMDSLEHVQDWQGTLSILSDHLRDEGALFSNNGILDDMTQPEHYELHPEDFIKACVDCRLMPNTQLSYMKKAKVQQEVFAHG